MNPSEKPIARIPEPFSEPQTIPAGWDVSAFDNEEQEPGIHHEEKDIASISPKSSKKGYDSITNAL